MARRTYRLEPEMSTALAKGPAEYIEEWWNAHSTEEERKAAEDRGATPSGALAFVESVVRKHGKGGRCCLPDDLTYRLAGIFMRNGADGDEFMTEEELQTKEAAEARRKADAEKRKSSAQKKERKRKSGLTAEQKAEEKKIEQERSAKSAEEESVRQMEQEAQEEQMEQHERAKAIAEEIRREQLEFVFN